MSEKLEFNPKEAIPLEDLPHCAPCSGYLPVAWILAGNEAVMVVQIIVTRKFTQFEYGRNLGRIVN